MEEAEEVITVSELLRRGRPLTGSTSLNSASPILSFSPPSSKLNSDKKPQYTPPQAPLPNSTSENPNPVLTALKNPTILVGTLTLPTGTIKCPNENCFQFSDDDDSSICADILDFSVRTIGNKIRVLAWNFIPMKHSNGGFLEIIRWTLVNSGGVLSQCSTFCSIPLVSSIPSSPPSRKDESKARAVRGLIQSISPVTLVPCSIGSGESRNLRGFITRILSCQCESCNSEDLVGVKHDIVDRHDHHSFTKLLFIYFCGSFSCWHPAITKLVGNFVTLSGLKKKLVFIGKEESQLMFVITKMSVLHLCHPAKNLLPSMRKSIKGKGECGLYTGVIRGMYMQGMVVELDKEVWLLLTSQLCAVPHSLRVGAIISVRNVHFVNPKFPWTKMLILGACFRTNITVQSFSPSETRCYKCSKTESHLGKFIESLNFSARLWVLLIISCFRRKFAGILSEKEILGSKNKGGLAQVYATSQLSASAFRTRHGILSEICKHHSCGCGHEPYCGNVKLVAPISTFLHYCEAMSMRALLQLEKKCPCFSDDTHFSIPSFKGGPHGQFLRRIFSSEDIGVVLLGQLKISPSSGRLQLIDGTGTVDVIVPDLPSTLKADTIYEVVDYCLVMEGAPEPVSHWGLLANDLLSCRHIFHCTPWTREKLKIYAYFHLRNATFKNHPFYPSLTQDENFEQLQSGRFHLILITHKYPTLRKSFQGGKVISEGSTMLIEAIVLPWDLFLARKVGSSYSMNVSGDQLHDALEQNNVNDIQELPNKKQKTDQTLSRTLDSHLEDDQSSLSSTSIDTAKLNHRNFGSLEIPCAATIRNNSSCRLVATGILCCTNCKENTGINCEQSAVKVLLEFNSGSFFKYQIGGYYITMHHTDENLCSTKGYDKTSIRKAVDTSRLELWSLSFSSDDVVTSNVTSDGVSMDASTFRNGEDFIGDQDELILQCSMGSSTESFADVRLHLSVDAKALLEGKLSGMKEGLINPAAVQEETFHDSPNILTRTHISGISAECDSKHLFPEGSLVSVHGLVVAIHDFDYNFADPHLRCEYQGDILQNRSFEEVTTSCCIHISLGNQTVNISSTLDNYAYPVGFGPGVVATFHRILKLRASRLMLTPASFIVINSLKNLSDLCYEKSAASSDSCSALHMSTTFSLENVSSGMIYDLLQSDDCKPIQLYCRIVAVHTLVLEKNRNYNYVQSKVSYKSSFVNIPLAGFVLDDGSSSCYCWADSERAATFLRLTETLPPKSSGCTGKWLVVENKTMMYHLERILGKHERITIKNYGSMFDSSYQDLTVSVGSADALSSSDENFLKFMVFNACFGTIWTVVASVMDSAAIEQLESKNLVQMKMMHPKQNIWAVKVCYTDTLAASRNLVQDLLSR